MRTAMPFGEVWEAVVPSNGDDDGKCGQHRPNFRLYFSRGMVSTLGGSGKDCRNA